MEQTAGSKLLIDCGRASTRTRGMPFQLLWEGGFAPFNTIYLVW